MKNIKILIHQGNLNSTVNLLCWFRLKALNLLRPDTTIKLSDQSFLRVLILISIYNQQGLKTSVATEQKIFF